MERLELSTGGNGLKSCSPRAALTIIRSQMLGIEAEVVEHATVPIIGIVIFLGIIGVLGALGTLLFG